MKNIYVLITISMFSLQVFAQGYSLMDTVYTPTGYPEGPLKATIYMPSTSNGIGVVLAHWLTGTRQTPHAWCETFAANGYVAMTIDYYDFGSSVNSRYPKPIRAYKTAIEFLRLNAKRFGIRTGKIVGFGQSEGSIHWGEAITENHDDAFLGIDSLVADSVDAAVLLYGAYDNENFLQSILGYDQYLVNYFADYPDFRATKGNCIANFLNIRCPVLLFHGTNDNILQFQQSLELHDSLAAHHMNVELLSSNSWDHGFDLIDQSFNFTTEGLAAKDSVLAFLSRTLNPILGIENEIQLPGKFSLDQNYPNPFNPSTKISYSLPSASVVKVIVYNTIGQTVKILENGFKNAGNYSVNFNATELPSGTYFYKIEAGQFSQVKKMILMK